MENRYRVLGIAPYEGMKKLMSDLVEDYPEIDLTLFVGDLEEGLEIAHSNFHGSYDVVISRWWRFRYPCTISCAHSSWRVLPPGRERSPWLPLTTSPPTRGCCATYWITTSISARWTTARKQRRSLPGCSRTAARQSCAMRFPTQRPSVWVSTRFSSHPGPTASARRLSKHCFYAATRPVSGRKIFFFGNCSTVRSDRLSCWMTTGISTCPRWSTRPRDF